MIFFGHIFDSTDLMKIFTKKYRLPVTFLTISFLTVFTFFFYFHVMDISVPFAEIAPDESNPFTAEQKEIIYIGIISRYPPEIIYKGYQPIMDYLNSSTNYSFELKLSSTYQETVEQLVNNEVAGAFLGTYLYIRAHEQYGVKCILKPLNENNEPYSSSAVIVKSGSSIKSISDLKGKKLALPSSESFSGKWLTDSELAQYGLSVADLDTINYFDHHQNVIYQVLKGMYDVGVVKERVAKAYEKKGIRIIRNSEKIPGPPFVVPKNADPIITKTIKEAFLKIDLKNETHRKLLQSWDSEYSFGFVEADDSDFNQLRKILRLNGRVK